jgi:hypothetical protein
MFIQEEEIRYYNQADGLIAIQSFPIIRAERRRRSRVARTARRSRPPIPTTRSLKLTRNSNRRSLGAPRQDIGTLPRSATRSTPWPRGLLTLPDMNAWLMAIGSPHVRTGTYWLEYRKASPKVSGKDPATAIPQAVERVHWADYMAAEIGLPAAYDYGSQRGAYALYRATNWVGDNGWVAKMDYQFRGIFSSGDVFRTSGHIVDRWQGTKTGTGYVQAKFSSINQRGEDIMPGTAIFALPTRADAVSRRCRCGWPFAVTTVDLEISSKVATVTSNDPDTRRVRTRPANSSAFATPSNATEQSGRRWFETPARGCTPVPPSLTGPSRRGPDRIRTLRQCWSGV